MWNFIFLGSLGLLFLLAMAQHSLSWAVPGYDGLAPGLWLLFTLSYLRVLWKSVQKGEINGGTMTVWRCQNPALFWATVAIHLVMTAAVALGNGAALLRWLGWLG